MKTTSNTHLQPAPFIVGTGRCGTTLLRLMLDSHPDLAVPPETHFIPQIYNSCKHSGNETIECFMNTITESKYWHDFHIDTERLLHRISVITPFNISEALRNFYALYADGFGKHRWGDKTPWYGTSMQLIKEILPEARFIHLIRDGRDTALSVLKDHWGPTSITDAAEWWVLGIKRTRTQASELDYYLEVRYEDLVTNPETTLKLICEFIDLPWNKGMLDYHQNASKRLDELESVKLESGMLTPNERRGHFHLTSKPPIRSRIGRWKTEMTQQDIETFEIIAGPLLNDLGYSVNIDLSSDVLQSPWIDRLDQAKCLVKSLVPEGSRIILMDQEEWGTDGVIDGRLCFKFVEKDGQYWGPPIDDESGIREIARLRNAGAGYLVCAWPAFWWLNYYPRFNRYLRENYQCLVESDEVVIFDLR